MTFYFSVCHRLLGQSNTLTEGGFGGKLIKIRVLKIKNITYKCLKLKC